MTLKSPTVLLMLALLASGCAHYPVNARLKAVNPNTGYRFENAVIRTNSDDTFAGARLFRRRHPCGRFELRSASRTGKDGSRTRRAMSIACWTMSKWSLLFPAEVSPRRITRSGATASFRITNLDSSKSTPKLACCCELWILGTWRDWLLPDTAAATWRQNTTIICFSKAPRLPI